MKPFIVALMSVCAASFCHGAVIPNVPPIAAATAVKPLTLLVAGRDHRLFYEAYNDAGDIDGDGVIDTRFKPTIEYVGLFDSNVCYVYRPAAQRFEPASAASGPLRKCSGQWSGNWLNYITTSRIDALRKILYGGMREVDSPTETVLRRAYIPQDAHSWAKEYTSPAIDGYNIAEYTPLASPSAGRRHFFGNLTRNASTNCASLNSCSDALPPILAVVQNSTKRVWEWASKERPVLDNTHGGTLTDYVVRVQVCTATFNNGCKRYPNGTYKPTGLLHEYGESESMLFGLLTGSYDQSVAGGRLRKVISSFTNEVNPTTGQFTAAAAIVRTFNNLRIRDFNNGVTASYYRSGWITTRPPLPGEFPDWGNPIGEAMYEAVRYLAGKGTPTLAFMGSTAIDTEVGLGTVAWDDPYSGRPYCSRANLMVFSDVNISYDSDQLPGVDSNFGPGIPGDLPGFNAAAETNAIGAAEGVVGRRFIGQAGALYDSAPTPKEVVPGLGNIRGLAPEEPTKQGSYYAAGVARYAHRTDLRPSLPGKQSAMTFSVALASPLPRIEVPIPGGRKITLVPFAKSVGGGGINPAKGQYQPTNQIVDFYVNRIANSGPADADPSVNGGRYYAEFVINFEDVEQGADHDMDAIAIYAVHLNSDNTVTVKVTPVYQAGGIQHRIGYVITGTTADGIYLEVQDEADTVPYFLNTPPGKLPGHCDPSSGKPECDLLPYLGGSPSFATATRTFTANTSTPAATLLPDPLWYAAKWGGFEDRNGNGIPDLSVEWDENGDGVPDTYFLVQNPAKLRDQLRRTLESIVARTASLTRVTANSTSITAGTRIYTAQFESQYWSGDVRAYPMTPSGPGTTPAWSAASAMPAPAARKIYTRNSAGTPVELLWGNLTPADRSHFGSPQIIDYLRGVRAQEIQNGGIYRNRPIANVIGDIVHSSPVYVGDTQTVYVGSNDGMLHAFNANTGVEIFAYIPSTLLHRLRNLASPTYTHEYFVDGEIVVTNHTLTPGSNILVATLGRGGKGLFALNVTNPNAFNPYHTWERLDGSDPDLGYMLGKPVLTKLNNGEVAVIVGNGYNSTSGKAVLYVIRVSDGAILRKFDTLVGGDNGMGSPSAVDTDGDGDADLLYVGDLKGNVWKIDIGSSNPSSWDFAFKLGTTPQPFFVAKDSGGNTQPITAPIVSVINNVYGDPNYGKRFVFFGTGSYFRSTDPADPQTQTLYGLIDNGVPILNRTVLVSRTIVSETTFGGTDVRIFSGVTPLDMVGKSGWFLDFTTRPRERFIYGAMVLPLIRPTLVATSIIPSTDVCLPGGTGFINAIDPFTGGRIGFGIFDANDNDNFADDKVGSHYIGAIGTASMPTDPVLLGNRILSGGSDADTTNIRVNFGQRSTGRISWREIVRE
ncbi:pilus assembly protein [Tepidimonas charontis]|uniref:Type IV pilus biogenesis factor PilY1 n=1 Tax=Tepidimonas charontis TaxID=2267262 RepID=A0A554XFU2_9BURK|nr:PilC/PilY family type IV pilus protein [Tepidimonas charontis]TSE34688.1 Type IV pilus biogenesis factor PilY1 [Tepidimonas charontis]